MIEQATNERPRLSSIVRRKQRRGFDTAIHRFRLAWPAETDLPNLFERHSAICRKSDVRLLRIRPGLSKIVTGAQRRSPESRRRCPQAAPPCAPVIAME